MKKAISIVILGLGLGGCYGVEANTFQLVGSLVQGGAAMASSIVEQNRKEEEAKKAEEAKKLAKTEKTPEQLEREKNFAVYNKRLYELAERSYLYCEEQFKGYNKCVAVWQDKVLWGWNFHWGWSRSSGGTLMILDDNDFMLPLPSDEVINKAKVGEVYLGHLDDISSPKYEGYELLGSGHRIWDFKKHMPKYGGMRANAVFQAVEQDTSAYTQLVGI